MMDGCSLVLRHIIPLLPEVGDVQQPGKVVGHNIILACSVSDAELEWLESEVPPGESAVVVLHGVNPGQGTVISLQVEFPSQQVVPQALQGPSYGQALLLHSRVPGLTGQQLVAQVQDWSFFPQITLDQHGPQAHGRSFVWTRNRWLKSELLSTGEEHKQALRVWNAVLQSSFQVTGFLWSFAVKAVSGVTMEANWGTNRRYQLAKPKKDLISFFVRGRGQLRMA